MHISHGIFFFSENKRGALNQQLREKTGNVDLLYVTVTDAPKKTPVNMRNGPGPEVHSDPDSDGKFVCLHRTFEMHSWFYKLFK